ncbi:Uncharacterized protein dnm_092410 [Desulfonema magnum]|uniref:Uncharacterized protein n=1 Tax=Desulfonema magnum TaxID=45655 RepID=A0A975BXU5_9BACT|nr:Uncharacterized protein dnm_092410 [Desulfonema magnum]
MFYRLRSDTTVSKYIPFLNWVFLFKYFKQIGTVPAIGGKNIFR